MDRARRNLLRGLAAVPAATMFGGEAHAAGQQLKISHQFPIGVRSTLTGGIVTDGDFRDRLCRRFGTQLRGRTTNELIASVYGNSALMKSGEQFDAVRNGTLDLSLVPLSYAGKQVPEMNIGLMPGLVTSYEEGYAWKNAEIGKLLTRILDSLGIIIVTWIWQAGGVASRTKPLIAPEDAKGMTVRGGSQEMDMILKALGASVVTIPSSEIFMAMKRTTGDVLDAAMTSSTSLISFDLQQVAKYLTAGRKRAYWFMFEPLIMSKSVFAGLSKKQQDVILSLGAELETFALDAAKTDDRMVAEVYQKAGAEIYDLDDTMVKRWQTVARDTAWKSFAAKSEDCAKLLALAQKV